MDFEIIRMLDEWTDGWMQGFFFPFLWFIFGIEGFGGIWDGTGWEKWEYKTGRC
jgi:hypothetical protein